MAVLLSLSENNVYSNLIQKHLDPPFTILMSSNPKLLGKYWIRRYTFLCLDTQERDVDRLVELCEHLLLSGKLMSDGVDPWIGEFSYIIPFTFLPDQLFINLEICSYSF